MRLAACEPCIVSTDDALGKWPKEFRVAGGFDLVVPALAARSDADGDLVLVQMLHEAGSPRHLRNLLERFQKHIVAVLEESVDVKRTIGTVQLAFLGGRPKRRQQRHYTSHEADIKSAYKQRNGKVRRAYTWLRAPACP